MLSNAQMVDASPTVAQCAVASTTAILLICLAANISDRCAAESANHVGGAMAHQAMRWHDVSRQDRDAVVRLQHLSMSRAYVQAAQSVASDVSIERASHIRSITRAIDTDIVTTTQLLKKQCGGRGVVVDAARPVGAGGRL